MQNDTYLDELNQIRERQIAVIVEIDRIRDRFGNQVPADIERIQSDSLRIVHDIDEIRKKREDELNSFTGEDVLRRKASNFFTMRLCDNKAQHSML